MSNMVMSNDVHLEPGFAHPFQPENPVGIRGADRCDLLVSSLAPVAIFPAATKRDTCVWDGTTCSGGGYPYFQNAGAPEQG